MSFGQLIEELTDERELLLKEGIRLRNLPKSELLLQADRDARQRRLEQIDDALAELDRREQRRIELSAAEARKQAQDAAFEALEADREAMTIRWNELRQALVDLCQDAQDLQRLHITQTGRPGLTESQIGWRSVVNAALIYQPGRAIIARISDLPLGRSGRPAGA